MLDMPYRMSIIEVSKELRTWPRNRCSHSHSQADTHILTIVILATFCQIWRLVQKPPESFLLRAIRPLLIGPAHRHCHCHGPSQLDGSWPAAVYAIKAVPAALRGSRQFLPDPSFPGRSCSASLHLHTDIFTSSIPLYGGSS